MSQNKFVLVTGGAGFVGSRLCARLAAEGHRVISLDNHFTGSELEQLPGIEYRSGHTKDIARIVPEPVDLVFHLGEYARVEQSVFEPEVVHDLNVVGTAAVVAYWKDRKCKLVYAGSSTKFGDGGKTRETSPYASTKAANTELVKRTGDAEGLPYAITYFYNVFGPGERFGTYGTVIEIFKQQYMHGSPITVVSPGTQRRNFTHVDDVVDGLMMVGERGRGDEYGLGNDRSYAIMEVAKLFSDDIIMLPEREGNRMQSDLHTEKSHVLGWEAHRSLKEYIQAFLNAHSRGSAKEKRVLVFSTTFHPVAGLAEDALLSVIREMPQVQFDIVTSAFSPEAKSASAPLPNAHIFRVGRGHWTDKYLLPILGYRRARALARQHRYLFAWSLMASYAAIAAVLMKRVTGLPLLITLADQDISQLSVMKRFLLRLILTDADQVYGSEAQESHAARVSSRAAMRHSMGEGDALANQFRFVYASAIRKRTQL
jgi:UDP-glucose 4-epimerase